MKNKSMLLRKTFVTVHFSEADLCGGRSPRHGPELGDNRQEKSQTDGNALEAQPDTQQGRPEPRVFSKKPRISIRISSALFTVLSNRVSAFIHNFVEFGITIRGSFESEILKNLAQQL